MLNGSIGVCIKSDSLDKTARQAKKIKRSSTETGSSGEKTDETRLISTSTNRLKS